MDLDKLTSVDLKLNNYDDTTFDLKWTDSDKFAIGRRSTCSSGTPTVCCR